MERAKNTLSEKKYFVLKKMEDTKRAFLGYNSILFLNVPNSTFLKGLTHDFTQKFKNLQFLYFRAKFVILRQVKAWVERLFYTSRDLFFKLFSLFRNPCST